ncbi:hypothetical protein CPB83DRAFT_502248 [Crepidotus variabilis]|uniref:Uncharacterized protein n=1 Tax=Crepidotus variabilis TaxID=179855 RepID=A0A9P6ECA1_9AGAR|nr:hypothetical protein CPB83DRAFT_502248 [Crepidotus variabilis]
MFQVQRCLFCSPNYNLQNCIKHLMLWHHNKPNRQKFPFAFYILWSKLTDLGPSFQNIVQMLHTITISLIKQGALAFAFDTCYYNYHYSMQPKLFKQLFGKQNPIWGECLEAMSCNDHAVVVNFLLRNTPSSSMYILDANHFREVLQSEHFPKTHHLDYITGLLIELYAKQRFSELGRLANFVSETFILGIMAWKETSIKTGSHDDRKLNNLCIFLWNWRRSKPTIEPTPDTHTVDEDEEYMTDDRVI